jgi:hypothetical protein
MAHSWHELIERIHQAPQRAVVVVTGGGASAIANLLSIPGGSKTLLEAVVPYTEAALTDWLGRRPEHFCVEETALAMAAMAFQRACRLARDTQPELTDQKRGQANFHAPIDFAVGVSCTASLVSDRPKKGEHRCYVAVHSASGTSAYSLVMEKGVRDRAGEEQLVGHLILQALAHSAGLADLPNLELQGGESVAQQHVAATPLLAELLEGRRGVVWSLPDASAGHQPPHGAVPHQARQTSLHATIPIPLSAPAGVLCGAFDPLHHGHERLRAVAEKIVQGPVYYELSIRNVDKPPLDSLTVARRCAQFQNIPLALTSAPTFAEKALVLPGVVFVVGVDTAERIIAPRYYRGSEMESALRQIRDAGCRFLVAGRSVRDCFVTLSDLPISAEFDQLFTAVPPDQFREDISSTELRKPS